MNNELKKHLQNIQSELDRIYALSKELPIYDKKIIDTDLSVRAKNCLRSFDIFTVGDLCALNGNELKRWRNLGRKTHKDITDFMDKNKVKFGRL